MWLNSYTKDGFGYVKVTFCDLKHKDKDGNICDMIFSKNGIRYWTNKGKGCFKRKQVKSFYINDLGDFVDVFIHLNADNEWNELMKNKTS